MSERHHPVIDERTFQRRRLAVLAGLLVVVLAAAPFLGGAAGDGAPAVRVAAGDTTVRIASAGSPTAVRELLSETTTTLIEASGATTAPSTTAPPTTSTTTPEPPEDDAEPVEVEEVAPARTEVADRDGEPEAGPTAPAPAPTPPPTTAAPTTTRAPAPTTTTTTAPARTSEGYAYDDPQGTQVWYDLAQCESGGRWSIDTGNGYYGGLQFSLGTWESVGGTGYPHEHPAATQIEMGRRLQARQGWGAWPHCSEELGLR